MPPPSVPSHPPLPDLPSPGSKFIRLLAAFGVTAAVGAGPYLGKVGVPGFSALLTLIPDSLQPVVLPLSFALVSVITVWVYWYARQRVPDRVLKVLFPVASLAFLIAFVCFINAQNRSVVRIVVEGSTTHSFLVGWTRPAKPPCTDISNAECVRRVGLDDGKIADFWGDQGVQDSRLTLIGTYLATTSLFAMLVAIVVIGLSQGPQPNGAADEHG